MKTKDLRLGNYVTDNSGFTMYVVGIYEDTVLLNFKGNEGDVWEVNEEDLRGVVLDSELLIKAGFDWLEKDTFSIDNIYLTKCIDGTYLFRIGSYSIKYVKCIHQLQNLFYALTQKELEINL